MQLIVDFVEGQRAVYPQLGRSRVLPQTAAKPDFCRQIAYAVEQHAVVMSFITLHQDQHRFRLVETGQIPEITVLTIRIFRVCTTRRFRCGKNHCRAGRSHLCQQSLTAFMKFLLGHHIS
ncbi:hypothetical protein D3C71_1732620 [compost metagenome]